jgi:hypothetical protein
MSLDRHFCFRPQDAVLRSQVLALKVQFLIDQPGHVCPFRITCERKRRSWRSLGNGFHAKGIEAVLGFVRYTTGADCEDNEHTQFQHRWQRLYTQEPDYSWRRAAKGSGSAAQRD